VTIQGRMSETAVTKEMILATKTRVPTLALANRSAAVEYITRVLGRIAVVKTVAAPGWKLEIQTD
jgi:hypothetical protein